MNEAIANSAWSSFPATAIPVQAPFQILFLPINHKDVANADMVGNIYLPMRSQYKAIPVQALLLRIHALAV